MTTQHAVPLGGTLAASVLTLGLLAAPGAHAEGSAGTTEPPESVFVPAGEFCPSFGVIGEFSGPFSGSEKFLRDGRFLNHNVGTGTWTNPETGKSFVQRSRYMAVERYIAETNDLKIDITGRFFIGFIPGDIGPGGTVVTEVSTYSVVGHQSITFDLDTFLTTSYFLDGQIIDMCAVLAE
jgi:hypothetical protein